MFDTEVREADQAVSTVLTNRAHLLVASKANQIARLRAEANRLVLAAQWADLHAPESMPGPVDGWEQARRRLEGTYPVRLGGEGTPEVAANAPEELALVWHTTHGSVRRLMADALDLRHRLPRIWRHLVSQTGVAQVEPWQARKIADRTRTLTLEQAAEVDDQIACYLGQLAWTRLETIVDAAVTAADPTRAQQAEQVAARARFVGIGRANEHHITTLIARIDTLDATTLMALVNRIADLLGIEGDTEPADVRRATALGLLARPDHVLDLLRRHLPDDQPNPNGGESATPEPMEEQPNHLERALQGGTYTKATRSTRTGLIAPRVVLHVHLTDQVLSGAPGTCRVEGVGPVTAETVRDWLGRKDVTVTVRPVASPEHTYPADSYEIPRRIRDTLRYRNPADIYPWATSTSRTMDLDHTIAFRPRECGGPPGQTSVDNLGPATRGHHQPKTHRRIRLRQPAPGVYLWRTRHDFTYLVTNTGTWDLGTGPTPDPLWHAAAPRSPTRAAYEGAVTR